MFRVFFRKKSTFWKYLWIIQSVLVVLPFAVLFVGGFFVDVRWTSWHLFSYWYVVFFYILFIPKFLVSLSLQIGRKWCIPVFSVIFLSAEAIFLYGILVTRCRLEINSVEIKSAYVPDNFDGFRIAVISDIHLGVNSLDGQLLKRTVSALNSLEPDAVVQCGDLINIDVNELTSDAVDLLKDIKAPVYAVLGNHDQGFYFKDTLEIDPAKMLDSFRDIISDTLRWNLLENRNLFIRRGVDSIAVAGVSYPNNFGEYYNSVCGRSDLKGALEGINERDFSILLSHSPLMADSLAEKGRGVDIMLSGHTHSMQIRIAGYCPTFFIYKYPWGLYEVAGTTVYVNAGIGTVGIPLRIGASPEITLLTLKKI